MARSMTIESWRGPALWIIAIAFALFTIVTSVKPAVMPAGLIGIVNTVLLVAFALVHATALYGWKGVGVFATICLVVSNIAENLSILTGFPFGHYHYTDVLGPKLFLVPITIGGAYFGAGYLSWTIGLMLLARYGALLDRFARWAVPLAASLCMASWDFVLDPSASTINHYWIWENGGGFFGVPFTNYLGWLLTVFVFYALFAAIVTNERATPQLTPVAPNAGYWGLPCAMYALLGARYVITFFSPSTDTAFSDAVNHAWMRHDIYETAALAAIFSMFSFAALAALRLADARPAVKGQPAPAR